jgi:large subunit ribosomal protein L25
MEELELRADSRETLGKRVKHLRRRGITPIHLFGHGISSMALQCSSAELERVLAKAGHTGLIGLRLEGEARPRTVVVREVTRDWRDGKLLHVDFYQVKMEEKLKVEVPVVLVGEAPALKSKLNTLKCEVDTLTVECLPARIPTNIAVDVSLLTEPEQVIRVKDIRTDGDITIVNDPEVIVARIVSRPAEAEEGKVAEQAAEASEAAAVDKGKKEV